MEPTQANHSAKSQCCSTEDSNIQQTPQIPSIVRESAFQIYLPAIVSAILLAIGLSMEYIFTFSFFEGWIKLLFYIGTYLPVAYPVLIEAWQHLLKGSVFTEFFLMSIATLGAFGIGEYPEAVAVMLFYTVGELFQSAAVQNAKKNILSLLDMRPQSTAVWRSGQFIDIEPENVLIGEKIQVKVGEKVPLDGKLLSTITSLDTSALTGESMPMSKAKGDIILAGSINLSHVIEIEVAKKYSDSSIAKIIELVENASNKKAKPELLIRKLAKIYTPIVVYLAIALCLLPYFFVDTYVFSEWLYKALIFLVISCPCALVISIPLGYFGGLGAASKHGILFKGTTYLDIITKVNTLVMDKTGTMTKGRFRIEEIVSVQGVSESKLMAYAMSLESNSNHPIAAAIMKYSKSIEIPVATEVIEWAGKGLGGKIDQKKVLAGNASLLLTNNIKIENDFQEKSETVVFIAVDQTYVGHITLSDEIKEDALETVIRLKKAGIQELIMLSGDKDSITQKVAQKLQIDQAHGGLLPADKLSFVEAIKADKNKVIAFMGDGINDAPVLASSDLGIAMGGLGSDVAIETADMIIQTDQPSKLITGIQIGKSTNQIIWQNIYLAFGVKVVVLILGALGLATMWAAVFADVGVAFLAISNAIRLQRMKWK